ncbi:DUF4266 domain-containing protein [Flavobacterium aurantiibacter]|uniref:DUF4266 domain-containing protein n=1 Tax=Flavobacterium aurantiibacter TaxID=2023067 RepID=A0A255ZJ51_9FLAO|nr:DUF4266 domain-containing protein [Flavobacterium aurantiibacter]OYQ40650.1 hypothetical protein CHX27_13290 [Flavobacterium aurantiibacter]
MKNLFQLAILALVSFTGANCTSLKGYQKSKINDSEMTLAPRKVSKTELSFQSYREGSGGASSGKVGGGCGCN